MKKICIILLMVCSMICTALGFAACGADPVERVQTIVTFDDYDDVMLTLRKLGNSLAERKSIITKNILPRGTVR